MESLMALLMPCVVNGNIEAAVAQLNKDKCKAQAAAPNLVQWYELDDMNLPADSVAVIQLRGFLYSWETEWLVRQVKAAELNPNICGVVLDVDGPGGMISRIDQGVTAIEECSKPTATVVTGMMASAHFWLGASADRTFIASRICEVGSVGILCEHYNFREFFRQNGIDYRVIYPDTADLKNKETRAIDDKGDESPLKSHLEKLHGIFANDVARHLDIDYNPELPIFRGEMFDGTEAVALGYIDQQGTLDDAVKWVLAQSAVKKANQLY